MTNRSQGAPPQRSQECRKTLVSHRAAPGRVPACLPGVSCVFQDARAWVICGSQVLPLLSTANSQWDVVWHKMSPGTRAAYPSYQSADGHWCCLGQLGLVGLCFGLSAVWCLPGEGCRAWSSAAPVPSRGDSWRHWLPCFHSLQSAGRISVQLLLWLLCPWHTLDSPPFLLQESRGVAERTRTEEGREEALEM